MCMGMSPGQLPYLKSNNMQTNFLHYSCTQYTMYNFHFSCYDVRMKKLFILTILGMCLLTACGKSSTTEPQAETLPPVVTEISSETASSTDEAESVSGPDKELTIPSTLIGDELDPSDGGVQELGVDDDGNATYQIKLSTLEGIVNDISTQTEESITAILADDTNYPDVTDITVNKGYTEFTIHMSGEQMTINESMLMMSFYLVGNKYQIYAGGNPDEVVTTVIYVNDDTGDKISRSDSTSMN